MTGFDTALRSQQMLAPYQADAANRKQDAVSQLGNKIAMLPQQLRDGAEFMVRKELANAQLMSFEQDRQLNAMKLQQMRDLDEAMLRRHGVTLAQVQADTAKMEFDQKKQATQKEEVDYRSHLHRYETEAGVVKDQKTPGGYRKMTEDERKGRLKGIRDISDAMDKSQTHYSPELEASRLMQQAKAAEDMNDMELADNLMARARAIRGLPPMASDKPAPKAAPKRDLPPVPPQWNVPGIGEGNSRAVHDFFRSNFAMFKNQYKIHNGKEREVTDDEVENWIAAEMRNPRSPIRNLILMTLHKDGKLDPGTLQYQVGPDGPRIQMGQ